MTTDEEIQAKQMKMLKIVALEGLIILLLVYYFAVLNSLEDTKFMFVASVVPLSIGIYLVYLFPLSKEIGELQKRKVEEERLRR